MGEPSVKPRRTFTKRWNTTQQVEWSIARLTRCALITEGVWTEAEISSTLDPKTQIPYKSCTRTIDCLKKKNVDKKKDKEEERSRRRRRRNFHYGWNLNLPPPSLLTVHHVVYYTISRISC